MNSSYKLPSLSSFGNGNGLRDFESNLGPGMAAPAVMEDYYNPATGERTQVTAGYSPKQGTGWESMPRDLRNDQITPEEAYKMFPDLRNVSEKPRSTGNKIGTSNTTGYNPMASRDPNSFAQEYSIGLPPTMGGYRKKDIGALRD